VTPIVHFDVSFRLKVTASGVVSLFIDTVLFEEFIVTPLGQAAPSQSYVCTYEPPQLPPTP
jgi:hypothetical protein